MNTLAYGIFLIEEGIVVPNENNPGEFLMVKKEKE